MKKQQLLEVGDKIKRFEVTTEMDIEYEIISTTKTIAKSKDGVSFLRKIEYNTNKPKEYCYGEVKRKGELINSNRYFLINH
jgi:hypothetical protein